MLLVIGIEAVSWRIRELGTGRCLSDEIPWFDKGIQSNNTEDRELALHVTNPGSVLDTEKVMQVHQE